LAGVLSFIVFATYLGIQGYTSSRETILQDLSHSVWILAAGRLPYSILHAQRLKNVRKEFKLTKIKPETTSIKEDTLNHPTEIQQKSHSA